MVLQMKSAESGVYSRSQGRIEKTAAVFLRRTCTVSMPQKLSILSIYMLHQYGA